MRGFVDGPPPHGGGLSAFCEYLRGAMHTSIPSILLCAALAWLWSAPGLSAQEVEYYSSSHDQFAIQDGLYRTVDEFRHGIPVAPHLYSVSFNRKGHARVQSTVDGLDRAVILVHRGKVYTGTPVSATQTLMPMNGTTRDRYHYAVSTPTRVNRYGDILIEYYYIVIDTRGGGFYVFSHEQMIAQFRDHPDLYKTWSASARRDERLFFDLMTELNKREKPIGQ